MKAARSVPALLSGKILVPILAAALLLGLAAPPSQLREGSELRDALRQLQRQGLKIVFSSRLVSPELRVLEAPPVDGPLEVLDALLAPHGLAARPAPAGWLVVVRREDGPAPGGSADASLDPLTRIEEEVTVHPLIWIPVHVVRYGGPVRGLEAAHFEVLVDKRPIELTGFRVHDRVVGGAEPPSGDPRFEVGVSRRRFLLVFDQRGATLAGLDRARRAALRVVEETLEPGDLALVATYSPGVGLRLAEGFTPDRHRLETAVAAATDPRLGAATQGAPERRLAFDGGRREPGVEPEREMDSPVESEAAGSGRGLGVETAGNDRQDVHLAVDLIYSLRTLGTAAALFSGSTHVLFFSDGIDSTALTGLAGKSESERERIGALSSAAGAGKYWEVDSEERFGSSWAQRMVRDSLRKLERMSCRVHSFKTGSAASGAPIGTNSGDGLAWLARQTDGSFATEVDAFVDGLEGSLAKSAVTYLLGVEDPRRAPGISDLSHLSDASDPIRGGPAGSLKIRVTTPAGRDALVWHPRYLPPAGQPETNGLARTLLAVELLSAGLVGGDFQSFARVSRVPGTPNGAGELEVLLDTPSLMSTAAVDTPLTVDLWAYATTCAGEWVELARRRYSLPLESLGATELGSVLRIASPFELARGDHIVRTLVQIVDTGAVSLAVTEVGGGDACD